jgi:hypothetical protein
MVEKTKLAEGGVEEIALGREGSVAIVKSDGHMSANIDVLNGRGSNATVRGVESAKGFWEEETDVLEFISNGLGQRDQVHLPMP